MKKYDDKTLKRLQREVLEILKDFVKICEEHDLTYFGLYGTGIGALRPKGFIPWDDDIDIGMPREDYEKFIKIAAATMGDKYVIGNAEHLKNYPLMTTRWMKKGTEFREYTLRDLDCFLGIFMDIYAYDSVCDDKWGMIRQAYAAWFWSKLLILRHIPCPIPRMYRFGGMKAKLVNGVCAVIHGIMVLLRVSPDWIYQRCKKASMRYNHIKTRKLAYFAGEKPIFNMISRRNSFPLIRLPFEGVEVCFPKDIHRMLTSVYGDYMMLPPVEKRKNHCPYRLRFKVEE
jgi:lipopolysaccharide cholinephosphotransferase